MKPRLATVLVVDDNPVDRRLACDLVFRRAGMKAIAAADGREALEVIRKEKPDLVLTDLVMPEMDGLQLLQEVRAHYPLCPVILMTAHGSEEIAIQALQKGAASYLPKSNLARDLDETLQSVLSLARTKQQAPPEGARRDTSSQPLGEQPGRDDALDAMRTVLVVDDSVVDRRLACDLVEKCPGMKAVSAANGREALEVLHKEKPDVVLTDLLMPEMDGLALLQEVRAHYPLCPVVLMTAHGSEDMALQALKLGAASYVPKRFLARELAKTLEDVLLVAGRIHRRR